MKPTLEIIRGKDSENHAAEAACTFTNDILRMPEKAEDVNDCIDYVTAFGGELVAKVIATIVMNDYKRLGKDQATCQEVCNTLTADIAVKIAETSRQHIADMFAGTTIEQAVKVKGRRPEGKL